MVSLLRGPWPWYVVGPLIGLFVPALLLIDNKPFGMSASLRAICAAVAPRGIPFLSYDWKKISGWTIAMAAGLVVGGFLARTVLAGPPPQIAPETMERLVALGLGEAPTSLVPRALFSWGALLTWRGVLFVIGGGFLVGFGASYAGGCTSGHGITGLAAFELASLIAVLGMFAGGLFATHLLFPWIL